VTRLVSILLVVPCLALASNVPDVPTATYRSSASEVRITFFATDQNNRPVSDIREEDFAIVDDGMVIRNFRSLARSDETALDLVVLLDTSESVAPRFRETIREVRDLVAHSQFASEDNVSLVAFGGLRPVVICRGNCHDAEAEQKLLSVRAAGPTPLFDALSDGANLFTSRQTPGARPILVLFSDGGDTISKTSAREAVEAIINSGALLYAVDVNPARTTRQSSLLERMADATGGRYFWFRDGAANPLRAALDDLRASYIVTYPLPTHAIGFHSLRILPKHDLNLRFHCRDGYYYEPAIP